MLAPIASSPPPARAAAVPVTESDSKMLSCCVRLMGGLLPETYRPPPSAGLTGASVTWSLENTLPTTLAVGVTALGQPSWITAPPPIGSARSLVNVESVRVTSGPDGNAHVDVGRECRNSPPPRTPGVLAPSPVNVSWLNVNGELPVAPVFVRDT